MSGYNKKSIPYTDGTRHLEYILVKEEATSWIYRIICDEDYENPITVRFWKWASGLSVLSVPDQYRFIDRMELDHHPGGARTLSVNVKKVPEPDHVVARLDLFGNFHMGNQADPVIRKTMQDLRVLYHVDTDKELASILEPMLRNSRACVMTTHE